MIKSMTGFAEASHGESQIRCDVEIKAYNSRHLDAALYMPRSFNGYEDGIRKLVSRKISRGRVEVRVSIEDDSEGAMAFQVDTKRAEAYYQALDALKKKMGITSEITLETLLDGKDMILYEETKKDVDLVWKVVSVAVCNALDDLDTMRLGEGANLAVDIESRLCLIEQLLETVKKEAAMIPVIYRERLMERIDALTSGMDGLDPVRLAQEAAIMADKSDISEEIARAASHVKQFREIMASSEPGGKKLNFLIQEFNREFNTMGAKAGSSDLSHTIVDLKSELEKIREQVQNIE